MASPGPPGLSRVIGFRTYWAASHLETRVLARVIAALADAVPKIVAVTEVAPLSPPMVSVTRHRVLGPGQRGILCPRLEMCIAKCPWT